MNKKHLKFNGFQKICFNVIYSVNYRRSTYGYCSIVRFQFLPLRSDREKRTYLRLFCENEYFGIGGCFLITILHADLTITLPITVYNFHILKSREKNILYQKPIVCFPLTSIIKFPCCLYSLLLE